MKRTKPAEESPLVRFGRRVRDLRLHREMSQEELGAKSGLHFTYVGQCERGERNVTLLTVYMFADALSYEPDVLFAADLPTGVMPTPPGVKVRKGGGGGGGGGGAHAAALSFDAFTPRRVIVLSEAVTLPPAITAGRLDGWTAGSSSWSVRAIGSADKRWGALVDRSSGRSVNSKGTTSTTQRSGKRSDPATG